MADARAPRRPRPEALPPTRTPHASQVGTVDGDSFSVVSAVDGDKFKGLECSTDATQLRPSWRWDGPAQMTWHFETADGGRVQTDASGRILKRPKEQLGGAPAATPHVAAMSMPHAPAAGMPFAPGMEMAYAPAMGFAAGGVSAPPFVSPAAASTMQFMQPPVYMPQPGPAAMPSTAATALFAAQAAVAAAAQVNPPQVQQLPPAVPAVAPQPISAPQGGLP